MAGTAAKNNIQKTSPAAGLVMQQQQQQQQLLLLLLLQLHCKRACGREMHEGGEQQPLVLLEG